MKPDPFSDISFPIEEQAAITEGSSNAIGMMYDLLFILKPKANPNGKGRIPIQFSIIKSAVDEDSPPF